LNGIFRDWELLMRECVLLGTNSLPMVLVIGIFNGAVTAWQTRYQLQDYLPPDMVGAGLFKTVVLETGPVLTALVIAGRVSASIAAELGTMKVTEQIDALESMAIPAVRFLAVPRIVAMTLMMPILVIQANFVSIMGGAFVSTVLLGMSSQQFWGLIPSFFHAYEVFAGVFKAVFFGLSTSLIGCYIGFRTEGGAEGVGSSTITAFVWACLSILVIDFLLAVILF
jgi:phospholipid/cholesterol/gamma-HCH transport system permease protein